MTSECQTNLKTTTNAQDNDHYHDHNHDHKLIELETSTDRCGSSRQADLDPAKDPTGVASPKKKEAKYEETIIDGFAICAFESWEDLQDELNERIALDRANKDNVACEMSSSDKTIKKKKKSKHKDVTSIRSRDESGSFSQTRVSKTKAVKKDKKIPVEKIHKKKKKSPDEPAAGSTAKTTDKKPKVSNSKLSRNSMSANKKSSSLPRGDSQSANKSQQQQETQSNQINPSGSAINHQNSPNTSQPSKAHHLHEDIRQKSDPPHRILDQESPRKSSQPRAAPSYSPYGINPHPQSSMYDAASNDTKLPMHNTPHTNTHNRLDRSDIKQNSQPKQIDSKQSTSQHAISPGTQSTQSQMPCHQSSPSMYLPPPPPQRPLSPNMNHGAPPHHSHPFQHRPPNPYFYPPMGPNLQTPGAPYHPSHYPPQQPHSYPSPYHPPNQSPYYPHDTRNSHMTHSMSMYAPPHPPYQQHPQQSSSIVSSIRMSSLPAPYGSPYIITDTTISRQTSVVPPPMPTALEQAAASSVASRFGHHPSTIHSMNHYNAAAAAAAVAAQSRTASLYPNPQIPPEKSFLELARSYGGATGTHSATSSYPNLATYPPSSASYPSDPYGFDRWPRTALDHPQAGYNSLYQASNPLLAERSGSALGNVTRVPPYPAGMYPPPPF